MEEIKEYCIQRSGEAYCIYGLEHSTQEVSILPKQICRCKANPIKIPTSFLIDKVLKFIQEFKGTRIANTFSKKNKIGGISLSNFKTQKQLQESSLGVWWCDWHYDQQNQIEDLEIDPNKYSPLICDKGIKDIQRRKGSLSDRRFKNKTLTQTPHIREKTEKIPSGYEAW